MKNIAKPLALAVGLALSTVAIAGPSGHFDVKELDKKIDPCADFNCFVNAKWVAAHPIPPDRTRWGSFDALREGSLDAQRTIVESASKNPAQAKPGAKDFIAVVKGGHNQAAAKAFVQKVLSPQGQAALRAAGFGKP